MTMTRESLEDGTFFASVAKADPTLRLLTKEERAASLQKTLGDRLGREDVWVFAYGSLIWNPLIRFVEQRVALLRGWHRRFCLWAPVGRGTRERPGLMLGLERGGSCRGLAFRIAADSPMELELLWQREMISGAYVPRVLPLVTEAGPVKAVAFTVNQAGSRYADHLREDEVASVVATAHGMFGSCAEYMVGTLEHLRALGIKDRALERIYERVLGMVKATASKE
jgi:cation transport protein ChaC